MVQNTFDLGVVTELKCGIYDRKSVQKIIRSLLVAERRRPMEIYTRIKAGCSEYAINFGKEDNPLECTHQKTLR